MADGKIPIRELVTNQVRAHLDIVLAVGTSVQLDNFKSKRQDVQRVLREQESHEDSLIGRVIFNVFRLRENFYQLFSHGHY